MTCINLSASLRASATLVTVWTVAEACCRCACGFISFASRF